MTREGTYRLMTLSEYSRPNRVGYANNAQGGSGAGVPVRVSFVTVPAPEGKLHRKLMSITMNLIKIFVMTSDCQILHCVHFNFRTKCLKWGWLTV